MQTTKLEYSKNEALKEAQLRYERSPKGIARRKTYEQKPERVFRKSHIFVPIWRNKVRIEFLKNCLVDKTYRMKPRNLKKILDLVTYYNLNSENLVQAIRDLIKIYQKKLDYLERMK